MEKDAGSSSLPFDMNRFDETVPGGCPLCSSDVTKNRSKQSTYFLAMCENNDCTYFADNMDDESDSESATNPAADSAAGTTSDLASGSASSSKDSKSKAQRDRKRKLKTGKKFRKCFSKIIKSIDDLAALIDKNGLMRLEHKEKIFRKLIYSLEYASKKTPY